VFLLIKLFFLKEKFGYNNETKFPKSFDPVKAGMVKVEE
jgi:hypothetical protein